VSELIERASGPVAIAAARPGLLGLDDDVDVAAAIVRARALAGHGLDAELDALAEAAAAPVELSVEAASAELARHVGGHAVRRDRSARWVAPPVTAPPAASGPSPEGAPPLESGEHAALVNATEELPAAQLESHVGEVEPLDELDMDDAEYTDLGGIPEGGGVLGLSGRATATLPVATHTEDADQPVEPAHGVLHDPAHDLSLEELDDFEILAESEASEEELLAIDGELGLLADPPPAVAMPRTMSELDFAARLDLGDDSDPHLRAARPARSGYAAASDPHRDSAGHALAAFESGDDPLGDPDDTEAHEHSAARTGVQPIFEPETSNSFTLAGVLTDSLDLDAPSSSVQSIPTAAMPAEPAFLRDPPRPASRPRAAKLSPSLYDTPVEDHELEHALEALDVDLDDLSIPHAATHLQRGSSTSRPGPVIRPAGQTRAPPSGTRAPALAAAATSIRPGGPAPPTGRIVASRPPTDDDLVIEFEEED
jgi:hypothetical protein